MTFEHGADRVGAHVGVAVHVAPNPRREPKDGRDPVQGGLLSVALGQRRLERLVEPGNNSIDDIGQVEQHVLGFVRHGGAQLAVLFGLPGDGDAGSDATANRLLLEGHHGPGLHLLDQGARDVLLPCEQGATDCAGGMGGEDGRHAKLGQGASNVAPGHAAPREVSHHGLDTAWLVARPLASTAALSADAVHLFRHVRQTEVAREGTRELLGDTGGKPSHVLFEPIQCGCVPSPPGASRMPRVFDPLEQLLAPLFADHLAEQGAQVAHVRA
jgi:hypothetical protein